MDNVSKVLMEMDGGVVCHRCNGYGWLWDYELPNHQIDPFESYVDDTKYPCTWCHGKGYLIKNDN